MKLKTIEEKLCCPFDKSDLDLQIFTLDTDNDEVLEGMLSCATCERNYPIISGIPIMTPDEFREEALEKPVFDKWNQLLGQDPSPTPQIEGD
ncbi:MAG: hypothetical protein GX801_01945 [Fibrobacter sp.]|nr:hypothetical protein [Fibrobacter sp.]